MKKALAITAGMLLVAGASFASNTGFKLNYPLTFAPSGVSNGNWVSLPYFFFPNGNVGATPQNAIDLCGDWNGGSPGNTNVLSIARFETSADAPRTKFCATVLPKVFDLAKGEAYIAVPSKASVTLAVVGSHDDDFSSNKGGASKVTLVYTPTTTNNNLISVPYHSLSDNAIDLCGELNGGPAINTVVLSIARFDPVGDSPRTKFCATVLPKVFDLVPGEGYSLVPNGGTKTIDFDVY